MQGGRDGFDFGVPIDLSADDGVTKVRYYPVQDRPVIQRVMRLRRPRREQSLDAEAVLRVRADLQALESERQRRLDELDTLDRQARQRARLLEAQGLEQVPGQVQGRPSLPSERPAPVPVVRDTDLVRRVDLSE